MTILPAALILISVAAATQLCVAAADTVSIRPSALVQTPSADVILNEFLATSNATNALRDEDGELQGWIELYNRGTDSVDLSGWSLTDDPSEPGKWMLPDTVLPGNAFLLVFASGKDRRSTNPGLIAHANFKLNPNGEYLALMNADSPRQIVDALTPEFPEQSLNYSYGRQFDQSWVFLETPSPGAANSGISLTQRVEPVRTSANRGLFEHPFQLILRCDTPGSEIRYTLDGSEPTDRTGLVYTNTISVERTLVLRAAAFKAGCLPARTCAHTFLMNMPPALKSLPVISIVIDTNHLLGPSGIMGVSGGAWINGEWQPQNSGDYHNPSKRGIAWERPTSVEYLDPQGRDGFQINCGLRVHGSDYSRSRLDSQHKFSCRLYFRGEYGATKLNFPLFPDCAIESFDQVVLRAGNNDYYNPFITDELVRRLSAGTGHAAVHGTFVNLLINGKQYGYYNPTERIDKHFCQSWHGGGEDWDVITHSNEAQDGDTLAWNALLQFVNTNDITQPDVYQTVLQRLDATNFIDYMLVNLYGATGHWPYNNWRAARERAANSLFRFYVWDAEQAFGLEDPNWVALNMFNYIQILPNSIGNLYSNLHMQSEFRRLFADRVHLHFFNRGALTEERIMDWYLRYKTNLSGVISNMSATIPEIWIPQRRASFLSHCASEGVLNSSNAPVLNIHGGAVPAFFALSLSAPTGQVFYTLNGNDPRVPFSGTIAADAKLYVNGNTIILDRDTVVRARTLEGTNWSALTETAFSVAHHGLPLRIVEIMHDPIAGRACDFIELANLSGAALDASSVRVKGIGFQFPLGSILPGGAVIVLASDANPEAFQQRYPGVTPFGFFPGNMNASGDRIELIDARGNLVQTFDYRVDLDWQQQAIAQGQSLELMDARLNANDPAQWRPSSQPGGSPGIYEPPSAQPGVRLNEIYASGEGSPESISGPDWIELHNSTGSSVVIGGWSLRDTRGNAPFIFPLPTALDAGAFLVIYCRFNPATNELACAFGLDRNGDAVYLCNAQEQRVDSISFGQQIAGHSLSRIGDDPLAWELGFPTPGNANQTAALASPAHLALNEWMINPRNGDISWIEILNQDTNLPVELTGLCLVHGTQSDTIDRRSFLAPGGYIQLWLDRSAGIQHLKLLPSAESRTFILFSSTGELIDRVDYGLPEYGVSEGRYPDGAPSIRQFPLTATPAEANQAMDPNGPRINEVMVWPATLDSAPALPWLELYNPLTTGIDLSGSKLCVEANSTDSWTFPPGSQMDPGSHVVIGFDPSLPPSTNQITDPIPNTALALPRAGTCLSWFDSQGRLIDIIEFGPQAQGFSVGIIDGQWNLLSQPTPGQSNSPPMITAPIAHVKINEWMAKPPSGADWIELFNSATSPVDLSRCFLTDDPSLTGIHKSQFGPLSYLSAQGWLAVVADGVEPASPGHVSFSLNTQGEYLRLYSASSNLIDTIDFGLQLEGVSQGRWPDGVGVFYTFPLAASPGAANAADWDRDKDGMIDAWELACGLDPSNETDASADADADGASNLDEFRANTNPLDPSDVLSLTLEKTGMIVMMPPLTLSVPVPADRTISLDMATNLCAGNWHELRVWSSRDYPRRETIPLSNKGSSAARFYRLHVK